jgi:hypothetical protein
MSSSNPNTDEVLTQLTAMADMLKEVTAALAASETRATAYEAIAAEKHDRTGADPGASRRTGTCTGGQVQQDWVVGAIVPEINDGGKFPHMLGNG